MGEEFRYALRSEHDPHFVVCRRVGDGRTAEYRSALSAALRNGSGMGAGDAAAGARVYCDMFCRDDLFQADVDAQGGAYATGVLVLDVVGRDRRFDLGKAGTRASWTLAFWLIAVVFGYTTITNIFERPDGIKIASFFIFTIIASSFISRAMRSTEIRIDKIELDETAQSFIDELNEEGEIRVVTNRCETGDMTEYRFKEHEKRIDNHIPSTDPIVFYEIETGDASEFKGKLKVRGYDIGGYKILRTHAPAVPNAIAAFLLYLRRKTGKIPHVYFGWSEGNPIAVSGTIHSVW